MKQIPIEKLESYYLKLEVLELIKCEDCTQGIVYFDDKVKAIRKSEKAICNKHKYLENVIFYISKNHIYLICDICKKTIARINRTNKARKNIEKYIEKNKKLINNHMCKSTDLLIAKITSGKK